MTAPKKAVAATAAAAGIRFANCPLHGPSFTPKIGEAAFNLGADFIAWSEGYKAWRWLNTHRDAYTHYTATGCRTDSRHRNVGHDVIISVLKGWKILHHGQFWVDHELQVPPDGNKYHPERHGVWVLAEADGVRVLAVFWHPQPGPLRHLKVVMPHYRRSVRRVETRIEDLEREYKPDVVLAGGDLQVRGIGAWFGPKALFRRLGMTATRVGIVWTAWKGATAATRKRVNAPRLYAGLDHKWDITDLQVGD